MLETGYAASMVSNAIKQKISIIEINLTPVIEIGGLIIKSKAEEVVPLICSELMKNSIVPTIIKEVTKKEAEKSKNPSPPPASAVATVGSQK